MKKWLLLALISTLPLFSEGYKRNYYATLTPQESKDIQYIVSTLGSTSAVGLLFKKQSLEQAGDRIEQVHPLLFFAYVYSNPELKSSFSNIKGMAWNNFEDGMANSLEKAHSRENLNNEMVEDFAHQSHLDPKRLESFVKNKQWKAFVEFVRKQS